MSSNIDKIHDERLQFLYEATHTAFKISPKLAAFYGSQFFAALGPQHVSDTIYQDLCTYCGSPLVDGCSVSRVRVVRSNNQAKKENKRRMKKAKKNIVKIRLGGSTNKPPSTRKQRIEELKDRKNTIEYVCNLCQSRTVFDGSTRTQLRRAGLDKDSPNTVTAKLNTMNLLPPAKSVIKEETTPTPRSSSSNVVLEDKKNKRKKKSNLLAVLANKKKKDEEAMSGEFSLGDFLSNL